MTPLVSVVIPTRDRRAMLARALDSVNAQQFRDFEVIVIDDASTDGTASWIRATRPDICLIEMERPVGAAAARNRGVNCSRGKIVAFLDDDDVWHPAYLKAQVAQFEAHPESDLCTTNHVEIDPSGRCSLPDLRPLYRYPQSLVHFLAECPIHTLSVVGCRRTAFERVGRFNENLSIVHDLDWYIRFVASGGKMRHFDTVLVQHHIPGGLVTRYRCWFVEERAVHRQAFSTNHRVRQYQRRIRVLRAFFFARVGLAKGDFPFGLARLAEAVFVSPFDAMRIAALRLIRLHSHRAWDAATWDTQQ